MVAIGSSPDTVATARTPERLPAFFDELAGVGGGAGRRRPRPSGTARTRTRSSTCGCRGRRPQPLALVLHGGFWRAAYTSGTRPRSPSRSRRRAGRRPTSSTAGRAPARGARCSRTSRPPRRALGRGPTSRSATPRAGTSHCGSRRVATWRRRSRWPAVSDLVGAAVARLGADAVQEFLGGEPDEAGRVRRGRPGATASVRRAAAARPRRRRRPGPDLALADVRGARSAPRRRLPSPRARGGRPLRRDRPAPLRLGRDPRRDRRRALAA